MNLKQNFLDLTAWLLALGLFLFPGGQTIRNLLSDIFPQSSQASSQAETEGAAASSIKIINRSYLKLSPPTEGAAGSSLVIKTATLRLSPDYELKTNFDRSENELKVGPVEADENSRRKKFSGESLENFKQQLENGLPLSKSFVSPNILETFEPDIFLPTLEIKGAVGSSIFVTPPYLKVSPQAQGWPGGEMAITQISPNGKADCFATD